MSKNLQVSVETTEFQTEMLEEKIKLFETIIKLRFQRGKKGQRKSHLKQNLCI